MSAAVQPGVPAVAFFENDVAARRALADTNRFPRIPIGDPAPEQQSGLVVVTSSERMLLEHRSILDGDSRLRIIALSDNRFHDPRADNAVYAYLPANAPAWLLERMVENAAAHIQLLLRCEQASQHCANAARELEDLHGIGAALSAEHDTRRLLEMILTKSRQITSADAGSVYLVEEPATDAVEDRVSRSDHSPAQMRFALAQNDSLNIDFVETLLDVSSSSIAGYVAMTGDIVRIEDVYELPPGVPFTFSRSFDARCGYRTQSVLAVPMRNHKDEIVGVVQLINAKRNAAARLDSPASLAAEVVPFTDRNEQLMCSLASQAAVALDNSRLYSAIEKLFEGLVKASVTAIEARDPTTSGHSFRVANLTVALAEVVDRADGGPYAALHFSRNQMRELRYASLLHDFGKVAVREHVLVKARKLYSAQLQLLEQRFQFVKRTLQNASLQKRLERLLEHGQEDYLRKAPEFDTEIAVQLAQLDRWWEMITQLDEPSVVEDSIAQQQLLEIASQEYPDIQGVRRTLLTDNEVRLLSIRKGSLDEQERLQIESHVVHTFQFLRQIPWTKELRAIPQIARGHHEKLNGSGYPYRLTAPDIPVQTRMMTISDIFDALASGDRPYKKAVSPDRALNILGECVRDGELDPDLFQLFVEAKVFARWKTEPSAF